MNMIANCYLQYIYINYKDLEKFIKRLNFYKYR